MEHSLPCLVGKVRQVGYSPKSMNILRISHGNVARHSFTVAFASEDAKGQCHVFEHPLAMLSKGNKGGDSRETGALTDHFEGSFLLLLLLCLLRCCCGGKFIIVIIVLVLLLLLLLLFIALNCLAHDANGGLVMLRSRQCCRSHDLIYKYRDLYCSQKDEEEEEEISRLEEQNKKRSKQNCPGPMKSVQI